MTDFSRPPLELLQASRQKGYIGLHVEQGVPILDRDLNLQHDLLAATVRSLFTRYVGDGLAAPADGFAVTALPSGQNKQDFRIAAPDRGPGSFLVGGIEVSIPAPVNYSDQPGAPALTTPVAPPPDPRVDTVYLDVYLVEVDSAADPELTNALDVGMQTSIRLKPVWVVRVAEGAPLPEPPAGHNFCVLAELRRPRGVDAIEQPMIKDLRQKGLTVADLVRRIALIESALLLPAFGTPPFSPPRAAVGALITINGSNFTVGGSAATVLFGDKPASLRGTPTATQLQANVPTDLVPTGTDFVDVKVTVRNASGGEAVSDDTFRAARVVPAPTFASPPFPPNGPAGQPIGLNGTNFGWSPTVRFQGANADSPLVGTPTDTHIEVRVPTDLVPAGQTRDVRITVTTTGGSVTSTQFFRIIGA